MLHNLSYGLRPVKTIFLPFEFLTSLGFISGCERLAAIEENIVTAFTDVASDDNNRLTVVLNRAYKVCGFFSVLRVTMCVISFI
jgi:hypothetical protein